MATLRPLVKPKMPFWREQPSWPPVTNPNARLHSEENE
ncbi:hypothetical protein J1605_001336 [Eschrichtius robustus]|uniref:Uncharacterized protein n=1 Tax=Eschrichtius robustus TaxID=9764 RepID=A0AB34G7E2_ESCRO|nr:hypothetical protein J1605_001336 [Eschrichtius robustus]